MTEDLHEASTGGPSLVFADDANGVRFRISEAVLYDAAEVRDNIGADADGTPQYGRWLPVEIEKDDAWLLAPGELVEELQRLEAEAGRVYEVTRAEKSGNGETDPWEFNVESRDDDAQTRF